MNATGRKSHHHERHGGHEVHDTMILGHELVTLVSFDDEEPHPKYKHEEVKKMQDDLEEYKNHGRFESSDGLQNHFQVKHW